MRNYLEVSVCTQGRELIIRCSAYSLKLKVGVKGLGRAGRRGEGGQERAGGARRLGGPHTQPTPHILTQNSP